MIRSLEISFDNSSDKFSELKVPTSSRAIQENQIKKNGQVFRFGLRWIFFCFFWGMLGGASAQFIALDSQKYDEWKRAFGFVVNTINNVNYCQ